jgi:hypothetical protein
MSLLGKAMGDEADGAISEGLRPFRHYRHRYATQTKGNHVAAIRLKMVSFS